MKFFSLLLLFFLLCSNEIYSQQVNSWQQQALTVNCSGLLDSGPILRTSGTGEEHIVSGIYQAFAQRYNGINDDITSVQFWGRANPATGVAGNDVNVIIYDENVGLPGVKLGQVTVTLDSASVPYMVEAFFSSPVSVSADIIISIEPKFAGSDDFFIQHNSPPDGQLKNLILIKQASTWFKNIATGDPNFDYDFMILPVHTDTIIPDFTFMVTASTVDFTNQSSSASSYEWDFGDSNTSTAASPTHIYQSIGTFTVKLNAYGGDTSCFDTISKQVTVTSITDVNDGHGVESEMKFSLLTNLVNDNLVISVDQDLMIGIYNLIGREVLKVQLNRGTTKSIDISNFPQGLYFISGDKRPTALKFFKQ